MGRDRQEFPKLPSDLLELTNPDALVEFNEILLKACESEARRRYQSAEEMRADLEFLQRGQSIKRKRTEEQRWAVYRKVGLAVVLLAFIAILGSIGLRQFEPRPTGSRLQPSTNHEATILYDQARRIIEADDYKRYGFAWSNLNTAVQIDTNFTAAYALMSQMAIGEAWAINVEDRILTLRKLASRLMTLDSRLAESHCAESCVQFFDWEFDKAEKSIRRAIQLNPDCWLAHSLHGYYLCLWGHAERGRRELQIAERLEPSFAINQFCLGMPFYVDRKWDDAARQFSEALRLNPKLPFAHFWLGRVYQIRHEYSKAIEEFREAAINFGGNEAEATEPARQLQAAFDKDGESGYWQKCRELQQMKPSPNGYVIYVHLGARGEAIDLLRQSIHAHQIKDGGPVELLFDECWDDMRADPEFEKLVAEMKFPR